MCCMFLHHGNPANHLLVDCSWDSSLSHFSFSVTGIWVGSSEENQMCFGELKNNDEFFGKPITAYPANFCSKVMLVLLIKL